MDDCNQTFDAICYTDPSENQRLRRPIGHPHHGGRGHCCWNQHPQTYCTRTIQGESSHLCRSLNIATFYYAQIFSFIKAANFRF